MNERTKDKIRSWIWKDKVVEKCDLKNNICVNRTMDLAIEKTEKLERERILKIIRGFGKDGRFDSILINKDDLIEEIKKDET